MTMWLLAVALGHPVRLPPGEDLEAWTSVLELVGLEATTAPSDDGVQVSVSIVGDEWRLRATGLEGQVRAARVPAPQGPSEREAVAQLAASLVRDLEAPALPPLPPLPERPTPVVSSPPAKPTSAPRPAPSPVAPSPVAPSPVAPPPPPPTPARPIPPVQPAPPAGDPPTPEGPPPTEPTSSGAPPGPPVVPVQVVVDLPRSASVPVPEPSGTVEGDAPGLSPFAWGAVGLQLRASVAPALAAGAWAGVEGSWGRVGGGIEGTAPAALTGLDVEARVQRTSTWLGAWGRLGAVEPGLVAGGQLHRYVDDGGAQSVLLPTAGLSVAVVPLRALRVEGRVHRDLRRVEVFVGDDRLQVAEPWSVQLGVAWVPWHRADGAGRR